MRKIIILLFLFSMFLYSCNKNTGIQYLRCDVIWCYVIPFRENYTYKEGLVRLRISNINTDTLFIPYQAWYNNYKSIFKIQRSDYNEYSARITTDYPVKYVLPPKDSILIDLHYKVPESKSLDSSIEKSILEHLKVRYTIDKRDFANKKYKSPKFLILNKDNCIIGDVRSSLH